MGNFNPKLPTKHTGTDKYITFFVSRNRQPTGSDYRQPETGNLYSIGTIWQVGKNPTTGTEGEMFILTKIVANIAFWEILSGSSGTVVFLEGDTGGFIGPDPSGTIKILGGIGLTFDGNPLTNTITGNLTVPVSIQNGGTNATSMSVIDGTVYYDGTRLVTTATGSTGQILTSQGPGLPPVYQNNAAASTVVIQVFTSNGTYTPTPGLNYAIVEVVGGGGAGGGTSSASAGRSIGGGGGGSGEYASGVFSSSTIGGSQTVTIGTGGLGSSGNMGGNGSMTSLGSLITAAGGLGGDHGSDLLPSNALGGGGGSGGTGGTIRSAGAPGIPGFGIFVSTNLAWGGGGGNSFFGGAGIGSTTIGGGTGGNGASATGYGSGGGGGICTAGNGPFAGGNGTPGVVVITEFI